MTTEDHQPNEAFKQPKGRNVIPFIRPSQPPKWQTSRRGIYRGRGAPKHAQWNRQAYIQSDRIQASSDNDFKDDTPLDYTCESSLPHAQQSTGRSNNFPTSIHAPPNRAHKAYDASMPTPPFPTITSTVGPIQAAYKHPECMYTYRSPSPFTPAPSQNGGSLDTVKRRSREWESEEKEATKKRKAKAKSVVREMEIELPEGCKKGAASRSNSRSLFLADVRAGMKQAVGAKILHYRYTETHLIISYNPPDAPYINHPSGAPSNSDTPASNIIASNSNLQSVNVSGNPYPLYSATISGVMDSWGGNNEVPIQTARPSGSNVKLEELHSSSYRLNTPGAGIVNPSTSDMGASVANKTYTSIAEALSMSNVDLGELYNSIYTLVAPGNAYPAPIIPPGQNFLPEAETPQPQVELAHNTPKQITKLPRRFRSGTEILSYGPPLSPVPKASPPQEHNPTFLEVIEIEDTPPPSPQMQSSHSAENNASASRTPSPAITEELMQEETKPEPESQMEIFLEEETSTITRLPRASGDKPRRLLISYSQDRIYSASMHGYVQEIIIKTRRHTRELYTPPNADKEAVEDVSLFAPPFDNIAIVAQMHEENALSLLHLGDHEGNRCTAIARTSIDKDRQRRGVSAVAVLPSSGSSLSFVSAGYDHAMHLWSFDQDYISDEQPPVAGILDFQHTSVVQSLLANGTRLISGGADNCVRTWDLSAAQTLSTIRTSNSVYQLHRTAQPETILIEVGHRDSQFELHDCRLSAEGQPPLRFGYPSVQGAQGRFTRGAVDPQGWNTFVSGGRDGMVRVWDLRNVKHCKQETMCFPGQRIVQAAFAWDNLVVASEDNRLLFFDLLRS